MGAALGSAKPEDCTSWLTFSTDCPGCAGATVNQTTIIEDVASVHAGRDLCAALLVRRVQ